MGSDIERRSHDEKRHYRGVIHQQGRVTLAADGNEAREIATDEQRKDLLDVVGPEGTPAKDLTGAPGDGYKLSAPTPNGDFTIGAGTLYVGGIRTELEAPSIQYLAQPEWLDQPAADRQPPAGRHLVYLWLCEPEVSAAEAG